MITSSELTELCRYAIEHGFRGFATKNIAITSIWASHNGAGSISLKLYANRSLVYSDQFGLFDKEWAAALFGEGKRRCYLPVDPETAEIIKDGEGVYFASEWAYRISMAVHETDPIAYYHKAVFNG